MKPHAALSSAAAPGKPFLSLLRYNRPYWNEYAGGAALSLLHAALGAVMPLVVRGVVGAFESGAITYGRLGGLVGGLVGVFVIAGVGRYFQRTLMINASRKFEYDLRNDYYRRVLTLSRAFFNRTSTGDIMARATNDINFVRDFIGPGVMYTIDMLRVPVSLGMMIYLSAKLTLIAMIPLPFLSVAVYFLVRYMQRQSRVVQEQFSAITARVQENLAGARVVKAHGIADREVARFREEAEKYMRDNLRLVAVTSFAWPLIGILLGGAILLIIWRGGGFVLEGSLRLADLTAFLVCVIMLALPLAQFGWVLTLYQRGAVGMNRISEVLAATPDIRDEAGVRRDARIARGAIRFENVSFAYDGAAVLDNVSVDVAPGATVAIVGPTGSGKSTMVALITREYDPTAGRIRIDGTDLREIPLAVLREAIGCVPQDTFIFSDSIRHNLLLGRPDATEDEMRQACEIAQFAADVAEMPRGYDTLLGERGINLSGGQKQRLALARAILCKPCILVLDDALSSVDTQTEERILHGLRAVMATRTSIIISHRISAVRDADLIVVLEDGQVAETGDHAALVARAGLYAAMYRRQLLEKALEEEA
ncbi:MAG TPA: ABC transporter ATP-binding protein [Candidatus Hydrogenedentes bacterium]|nr:ABC transporter ATP-binding protein [Candidatus Hydrogenedentota bacterium]